ncbi:MAG: helix-turn-helix domain-containing protein, partial [Acidobacteriota bacterium]
GASPATWLALSYAGSRPWPVQRIAISINTVAILPPGALLRSPSTRDPSTLDRHRSADRLASLRKEKGLTQQAVAELVELHQAQIHRYKSGASEPSMSALKRLVLAPV